ncbi:MAG: hypothetical protein H5U02_12740 [Clostridia bacterium]|nr:hypothetical protein [Clostridia bacterium]
MANHKGTTFSTFQIAAAYVGTVVGAGFASGQEILQFFSSFGRWGLLGLASATVLFIFFGHIILQTGHRLGANSYQPLLIEVGGHWVGKAMDWFITFFLFGFLTVMAAGAGAIFAEQFGFTALWGSMLMVVLAVLTVLMGLSAVVSALSIVTPFLIAAVLIVGAANIWPYFASGAAVPPSTGTGAGMVAPQMRSPLGSNELAGSPAGAPPAGPGSWSNRLGITLSVPLLEKLGWSDWARAAAPFWPLAALLYASYNLILALPVLVPISNASRPRHLLRGAIAGGLGLGLGALAIYLAILANLPLIATREVPMLYAANNLAPWADLPYSLILLAEVYNTAVGSLYGFSVRLSDPATPRFRWLVIGSGAAAFLAAQLGFSRMVGTVFPAIGYVGLVFLGSLTYGCFKRGWRLRPVSPPHPTAAGPAAAKPRTPKKPP